MCELLVNGLWVTVVTSTSLDEDNSVFICAAELTMNQCRSTYNVCQEVVSEFNDKIT